MELSADETIRHFSEQDRFFIGVKGHIAGCHRNSGPSPLPRFAGGKIARALPGEVKFAHFPLHFWWFRGEGFEFCLRVGMFASFLGKRGGGKESFSAKSECDFAPSFYVPTRGVVAFAWLLPKVLIHCTVESASEGSKLFTST